MKVVVARGAAVEVAEEEKPSIAPSYLLIRTLYSAISPGTELAIIGSSRDMPVHLGYSAVGTVVECGESAVGFAPGDIVACYGAPYVKHSEYLLVPKTLCGLVPSSVSPEAASLAGIGAISIHALRVAKLQFGEKVVVAGLGIIGQLIAQIADAASYDVYAYDISAERADLLKSNPRIKSFSENDLLQDALGEGADSVLLCAGGKQSDLPDKSLTWLRDRGKVVIVGDIEPHFPRSKMFAKEAEILIARAGGPGRYDPLYEKEAIDYPYGFIRWTEGRNVCEYLRLVGEGRIDVSAYTEHTAALTEAAAAYETLKDKNSNVLTKIIAY